MKFAIKFSQQCAGDLWSDLVLNCDMGTPARGILGAHHAVEMLGNFVTNGIQFVGNDPKRDPAAQVHQAGDGRTWRRTACTKRKLPLRVLEGGRRQRVEHRQVHWNLIALWRIMGPAQPFEPCEIVATEVSRDDEAAQISTWLPNSTTRLVGSLKNSIALSALRSIQENSFSRQIAMPGRDDAISV